MSVCADPYNTLVVMGDESGLSVIECPLSNLWPFPFLYRLQQRGAIVSFAEKWALETKQPVDDIDLANKSTFLCIHQHATSCLQFERFHEIHPLRLAAAVVFSDGKVETAWQLKGIEYGCTLDPVSQLVSHIERRREATGIQLCQLCFSSKLSIDFELSTVSAPVEPVALVMTDQFGVCHAPFAQARSLLVEHGYGSVTVFVHDAEGKLNAVKASELLPVPPGNAKFLSHDDFV